MAALEAGTSSSSETSDSDRHEPSSRYPSSSTRYNTGELAKQGTMYGSDNVFDQYTSHSTQHTQAFAYKHSDIAESHAVQMYGGQPAIYYEQPNRSLSIQPTVYREVAEEPRFMQHSSLTDNYRGPLQTHIHDERGLRFSAADHEGQTTHDLLQSGPSSHPVASNFAKDNEIAKEDDTTHVRRSVSGNGTTVQRAAVFEMSKVNKIGTGYAKKFISTSNTLSVKNVAKVFEISERDVKIIVNEAFPSGHVARNIIIIAPNAETSSKYVIVESQMFSDKPYPSLFCVRIPFGGTSVTQLASDICRELGIRKIVVCEDDRILDNNTSIKSESGPTRTFKAVRNTRLAIKCVHMPANNVQSTFEIEADSGSNIGLLKEDFLRKFKENLFITETQTVQFSASGLMLDDELCIGAVTWPNREATFQMHIASTAAFCVNLKFKESVSKTKLPKSRSIAIEPNMSTASLRAMVAKHMGIDPKAVKLTLNNRRIEEMDILKEMGDIINGSTLIAGIKKRKTMRVQDASTRREEVFSIYMLEPVHVLKRMIAETFGIDSLHVSLEYKGRRLADSELLVNYPIKNQTEIKMKVFPNRVNVEIYIVFNKVRTTLTIDDSAKTTVDDLIRFCAITFNFDRRCARVQYNDRCLSRFSTLAEENLQDNNKLVIVYFDQPVKLEGGLICIFTVREDGQVNPRLGAVNGGYLLHASKKVKPRPVENYSNKTEVLPEGIRVYEKLPVYADDSDISKKIKEEQKREHPTRDISASERNALRQRFVERARRLRRRNLGSGFPHPEIEEPFDRCMPFQSSPLNVLDLDSDSETELKRTTVSLDKKRDAGRKQNTSSPDADGSVTVNIANNLSCIENCCRNIQNQMTASVGSQMEHGAIHACHYREEIANPNTPIGTVRRSSESNHSVSSTEHFMRENVELQLVRNPESFIAEEQGRDKGKPVFGDTSGSASDLLRTGGQRGVEFTLGTESSDQDTGWVSDSRQRFTRGQLNLSRCPFLRRGMGRRRTRTEGEFHLIEQCTEMVPHAETYPDLMRSVCGNEWLNTGGITIEMFLVVSRKVGGKWRNLARRLGVPEEDIENIDTSSKDQHEKAFNILKEWKQTNGRLATKEQLIQSLREVEMVALAEFVEQLCGNQTV